MASVARPEDAELTRQIALAAACGTRDPVFSDFGTVATLPETLRALAPRSLVLERGRIDAVDSLATLPGLQRLSLIELDCPNLSPIGKCADLRELQLEDVPLEDLGFLTGLQYLTSLTLEAFEPVYLTRGGGPVDLSPLSALGSLESLVVEAPRGQPLTGGRGLGTLPRLRRLSLTAERLDALPQPGDGAPIEALSLSGCPIDDITPVLGFTTLRSLAFRGSDLPGLPDLSPLENLTELVVAGTNLTRIDPVAQLVHLQSLDITDSQVSDLAPLTGLKQLRRLNISRSQVSDLSPLAGLPALEALHFVDAPVDDLLPLLDMPALWAAADPVTGPDIGIGGTGQASTDLLLYFVGRTDAERFRNLHDFLRTVRHNMQRKDADP